MKRREFVKNLTLASVLSLVPGTLGKAREYPKILVRSSWQTVNIGDIAHTPGLLRLLDRYLPDTEVTLWANTLDLGVEELLRSNFPKLKIVGQDTTLEEAFVQCDFLLHGSGASLVARGDVANWRAKTKKPYGILGISLAPQDSWRTEPTPKEILDEAIDLINSAEFVFFRDRQSLAFATSIGGRCPIMEFGPDAAFACDLRNDEKAISFMNANRLEEGRFLCCIPRLRYSPYWMIPSKNRKLDRDKHARNEEMKEHDHAPLREAIESIVRNTEYKVLVCPEDMTQMQVGKEMIYDKLAEDIRERVVWKESYWLTDEAVSVYVRSLGVFGNELHSQIMCIGHGVPAVVCRWKEQTSKGTMLNDIGLSEWLFDLDDATQLRRVAPTVLEIAQDPERAREKACHAQRLVVGMHRKAMGDLKRSLDTSS